MSEDTCEDCGSTEEVRLMDDPLTLELDNERLPLMLCQVCYKQRWDDV